MKRTSGQEQTLQPNTKHVLLVYLKFHKAIKVQTVENKPYEASWCRGGVFVVLYASRLRIVHHFVNIR